jgi:hypothetical protein
MKPIIGENIWIKVSIGCSSFVIELPTLSLAEQPVDFNLFKFQISLARIYARIVATLADFILPFSRKNFTRSKKN